MKNLNLLYCPVFASFAFFWHGYAIRSPYAPLVSPVHPLNSQLCVATLSSPGVSFVARIHPEISFLAPILPFRDVTICNDPCVHGPLCFPLAFDECPHLALKTIGLNHPDKKTSPHLPIYSPPAILMVCAPSMIVRGVCIGRFLSCSALVWGFIINDCGHGDGTVIHTLMFRAIRTRLR
ncbi:hypothetical protein M413DRAFT_190895 [Hebeloma cylindrosporum]|uniref:Uncharacterized protein n=1 Tax=Hebeloma cylindrosporum TaxID=76867 RepID=A0A0C2XP32_HEBCY|nr:hypothetical protein M413DRAFT_190895 [Hebeloma cylindrosporum h7]